MISVQKSPLYKTIAILTKSTKANASRPISGPYWNWCIAGPKSTEAVTSVSIAAHSEGHTQEGEDSKNWEGGDFHFVWSWFVLKKIK